MTDPSLQAAQALAAAASSFAATQSAASPVPSATAAASPKKAANSALLPYALLSKDEQKLFQSKFRAAQKSPQLVELQIKSLDGLIAFLKQKRDTSGRIISDAEAELALIAKEEAMIHMRYDPLAARIASNESKRSDLLRTRAAADEQLRAIMTHTAGAVSKTQHAIDAFKQKQLKQALDFEKRRNIRPTKAATTTTKG